MDPNSGVVHVRPEDMSDERWAVHVEEHALVRLPSNRHEKRGAAVLARLSARQRGKVPPPPPRKKRG